MPTQLHRNFDTYAAAFNFARETAMKTGVVQSITPWESLKDGSSGFDVHAFEVHARRGHGRMVVFPDGVAADNYWAYNREFSRRS